jgi:hypothetical protein
VVVVVLGENGEKVLFLVVPLGGTVIVYTLVDRPESKETPSEFKREEKSY